MTVEIRVSTRPGWYQLTPLAIRSAALADHLGRLALGEWARWHRRRDIEVTARERGGDLEAHVRIPAMRPVSVRIQRGRR